MNTQRKSLLWLALCITLVLIAIIIAFNAQIGTSVIMKDMTTGHFETGIGSHVVVIMAFFVLAAVFVMLHLKIKLPETQKYNRWIIVALFIVTGFFFALATGYYQRFDTYAGFYNDMVNAPYWYSEDVINEWWFNSIPQYAESFHTRESTFFVLTVVTAIATVAAYVVLPKLRQNTSKIVSAHCPRCNEAVRGMGIEFCPQCGAKLQNGSIAASTPEETTDANPEEKTRSNGLKPTRWAGE